MKSRFFKNFAYINVFRMVMVQEAGESDALWASESESNAFLLKLKEICEEQGLYKQADLTRDELAHQMNIGHTAFTLQLKQATGLTFYDYINQLRIRKATELIEEGKMDIGSISQQVGFRYRSTFYRAFFAVHGCTPTNYQSK